jgi:uncharacterized protein YbbK (DUF523 family)
MRRDSKADDGFEARKPRLGVSACLLGHEVRYDGGHKLDRIVSVALAELFDFVPVCPEVESGLGTPRPAMHLIRSDEGIRMVETASGRDCSDTIKLWADERIRVLTGLELSGFVLKRNSPSCGWSGVPVEGDDGQSSRGARGLFADALARAFPQLPLVDENLLADPELRADFVARAFAYRRLIDS